MHETAPESGAYVPAAHTGHELEPDGELTRVALPARQGRHVERPITSAYVPALHDTQLACPSVDCALPSPHSVQTDFPPASVYDPAGHAVHEVEFGPAENCPS